jgi:hypothetical protein
MRNLLDQHVSVSSKRQAVLGLERFDPSAAHALPRPLVPDAVRQLVEPTIVADHKDVVVGD